MYYQTFEYLVQCQELNFLPIFFDKLKNFDKFKN